MHNELYSFRYWNRFYPKNKLFGKESLYHLGLQKNNIEKTHLHYLVLHNANRIYTVVAKGLASVLSINEMNLSWNLNEIEYFYFQSFKQSVNRVISC